MKTIVIIVMFTIQLAIAQTRMYKEVTPKLISSKSNSSDVILDYTYKYGELFYKFGYVKQKGLINGIKVSVLNKNQQVVFNTIVKNNGGYYWVRFYKTDNVADGSLFVLDATDGTNANSFGNMVFQAKGEKIKQIGLLDVAFGGPKTLNTVVSIINYTTMKTDGKVINFDFKIDSLFYKLDYTKKLKLIKGSSISYIYQDNKLKVIKK